MESTHFEAKMLMLTKDIHQWLRSASLKAETKGFIIVAQYQRLFTKNYQVKMIKNDTD